MSKPRVFLLALSFLLLGLFIGGWAVAREMSRQVSDSHVAQCVRDSQMIVTTLKKLRAEDPASAIQLLETNLDSALFLLGTPIPESPLDPIQRRVVREVRDYRTAYPHPAKGPSADGIANAFKLADEPSSR